VLLPFILALAGDPDLQEAFLRNPTEVVMARNDLSAEEREILLTCDPTRMAVAITDEIGEERAGGEHLPAVNERPLGIPFGAMTPMLAMVHPAPWVYGTQTMTGFFWELKDKKLTLTVYGTRLKGAYPRVELRHGQTSIPGQIGDVEGNDEGEQVAVSFSLTDDVKVGVYQVFVDMRGSTMDLIGEVVSMDGLLDLGLGYELRRGGG